MRQPQVEKLCTPILATVFLSLPGSSKRVPARFISTIVVFLFDVLITDKDISFDIFRFHSFLYRIKQLIVSAAKNQIISLKTKSSSQVWKVLMEHFAFILEKSLSDVVIDSSKPEMTDGELYVYDRLYSTTCHKESHPVEQVVYITPRMFEPCLY